MHRDDWRIACLGNYRFPLASVRHETYPDRSSVHTYLAEPLMTTTATNRFPIWYRIESINSALVDDASHRPDTFRRVSKWETAEVKREVTEEKGIAGERARHDCKKEKRGMKGNIRDARKRAGWQPVADSYR